MATAETICKFNQSGFCKFLTHCRKHHIMDTCQNTQCINSTCLLRHPRMCKYYLNFGRCKFGTTCAYLHESGNKVEDHQISELKSELEKIKTKIKNVELLQLKLDKLENQLKAAEEAKISIEVESKSKTLHAEDRLKELEQNFYILMNSVDDLEKTSAYLRNNLEILKEQFEKFKCNLCGQTFADQPNLRNHFRTQHET